MSSREVFVKVDQVPDIDIITITMTLTLCSIDIWSRLLQLGVLAATAKYPLSASAERAFANFRDKKHRILQLQIFATKHRFYTFLQQKRPALALTALR